MRVMRVTHYPVCRHRRPQLCFHVPWVETTRQAKFISPPDRRHISRSLGPSSKSQFSTVQYSTVTASPAQFYCLHRPLSEPRGERTRTHFLAIDLERRVRLGHSCSPQNPAPLRVKVAHRIQWGPIISQPKTGETWRGVCFHELPQLLSLSLCSIAYQIGNHRANFGGAYVYVT
jgi:hypothetical protein